MSEDWLDIGEKAGLPAPVTLPDDYKSRLALVETCWQQLSEGQRTFLHAWRDCRFNARAAARQLGGGRTSHVQWMHEPEYATVVRVWRANAAANALDRDRLLARQDDIVETLLEPKPVIHQGLMVRDTRPGAKFDAVLEEVEAGAASRANETLMKAAGLLKDKDAEINVNVGIVGPALSIQVMPAPPSKNAVRESVTIDMPALPAVSPEDIGPQDKGEDASPASDDGWLD